jgi:orotate phosphoribosyltransferase-like protein
MGNEENMMSKKLIVVAAIVLAGTGMARTAQQIKKHDGKESNNPAVCPVASCGGTHFQQMTGTTVN